MRKFPFNTWRRHARWILIFGLLAGLFFSGGEGVQLFPFPISESDSSKNTSYILEKNLKSYAFSVHTFGNHSTLLKSKFQKNDNQNAAGRYFLPDQSNTLANFCLQSVHSPEESTLSQLSLVLGSQPERAPPAI